MGREGLRFAYVAVKTTENLVPRSFHEPSLRHPLSNIRSFLTFKRTRFEYSNIRFKINGNELAPGGQRAHKDSNLSQVL